MLSLLAGGGFDKLLEAGKTEPLMVVWMWAVSDDIVSTFLET